MGILKRCQCMVELKEGIVSESAWLHCRSPFEVENFLWLVAEEESRSQVKS